MVRFTWSLILLGIDFSPEVLLPFLCDELEIKDRNERGDIGKKGKYKGIAQPYGSCVLTSSKRDFEYFLANVTKALNGYESQNKVIDDKILTLNVFYQGQCNFELDSKVVNLLNENNLSLEISCYIDS